MSQDAEAKEALRYYLQNSERIDPAEMMRNMAIKWPSAFNAFIAEIVGTTPARLAGLLAKRDPAVFLELAKNENRHWEASKEIMALMKEARISPAANSNGNKVMAIKKIREAWGFGLKEAKDIADVLHQTLHELNFTPEYVSSTTFDLLTPEQQNAYNLIMEHL